MLQKASISGVSTVDLWSLICAGTQQDTTTDSTTVSAIDINSHLVGSPVSCSKRFSMSESDGSPLLEEVYQESEL